MTQNLPALASPSHHIPSIFDDFQSFEAGQRIAKALSASNLVPTAYQGAEGLANTMVALDMARRVNASPLMVMQNLHVIEGKPVWSSQFVIASLNSCGKFGPLRFRKTDRGEREVTHDKWVGPKGDRKKVTERLKIRDVACVAYAVERGTGEVLEGPEVSMAMAVAEGWFTKPGSKWVTMPDLMLMYRAAKFFGNLYAPEIMMGLQTADEITDVEYTVVSEPVAPAQPAPVEAAAAPAEPKPKRARGVAAAMSAKPAEPAPIAVQEPDPDPVSDDEPPADDDAIDAEDDTYEDPI